MDDSDDDLRRAIAASLGSESPPAAPAAAASEPPAIAENDDEDEAYARALQASLESPEPLPQAAQLRQQAARNEVLLGGTGLPATFPMPGPDGRPFTPRSDTEVQEAIMASNRVQNRE